MSEEISSKIESFEEAFRSSCTGCVRTCECGKQFYDTENSYDWEDGEFEKLEADKSATPLNYSVGTIELEGREYVRDCECWKPRARKIIGFIESNGHAIASYFAREKKRKENEAARTPTIKL